MNHVANNESIRGKFETCKLKYNPEAKFFFCFSTIDIKFTPEIKQPAIKFYLPVKQFFFS